MKSKMRLLITLAMCVAVFSIASCFAATSGEENFIAALTDADTGITADTLWGAVIPVAPIIVFTFIFAFAYRIIKRVLKKGSAGKFGM